MLDVIKLPLITRGVICSGLGSLLTRSNSAIATLGVRGQAGGGVSLSKKTSCGVDTSASGSLYGCLGGHYFTMRRSASLCVGYGGLHCGHLHFNK